MSEVQCNQLIFQGKLLDFLLSVVTIAQIDTRDIEYLLKVNLKQLLFK